MNRYIRTKYVTNSSSTAFLLSDVAGAIKDASSYLENQWVDVNEADLSELKSAAFKLCKTIDSYEKRKADEEIAWND